MGDFKEDPNRKLFESAPTPIPAPQFVQRPPPRAFDVRDHAIVILIEPHYVYERKLFDFETMVNRRIHSIAVARISCDDADWSLICSKGELLVQIGDFQDKVPVWWMRERSWNPPHLALRGQHVAVTLIVPPLAATSIIGFGINNEVMYR